MAAKFSYIKFQKHQIPDGMDSGISLSIQDLQLIKIHQKMCVGMAAHYLLVGVESHDLSAYYNDFLSPYTSYIRFSGRLLHKRQGRPEC